MFNLVSLIPGWNTWYRWRTINWKEASVLQSILIGSEPTFAHFKNGKTCKIAWTETKKHFAPVKTEKGQMKAFFEHMKWKIENKCEYNIYKLWNRDDYIVNM